MGLCGRVAELGDDGWEEEGECVQGQRHGVEAEAVEPAFVVFEGGEDVAPGEGLGVVGVCAFEACLNECSFGLGEEGSCRGVVMDEEIGYKGNHYGKKAFLFPFISFISVQDRARLDLRE